MPMRRLFVVMSLVTASWLVGGCVDPTPAADVPHRSGTTTTVGRPVQWPYGTVEVAVGETVRTGDLVLRPVGSAKGVTDGILVEAESKTPPASMSAVFVYNQEQSVGAHTVTIYPVRWPDEHPSSIGVLIVNDHGDVEHLDAREPGTTKPSS